MKPVTQTELKTTLSRMADDLLDVIEVLPDEQARILRKSMYGIEEVRLAVGEAITVAVRQHSKLVGPVEYDVLREKKTRLAA